MRLITECLSRSTLWRGCARFLRLMTDKNEAVKSDGAKDSPPLCFALFLATWVRRMCSGAYKHPAVIKHEESESGRDVARWVPIPAHCVKVPGPCPHPHFDRVGTARP